MKRINVKFITLIVLAFCQLACGQNNTQNAETKSQSNVVSETKTDVQTEYPNLRKQAQEFCDAVVNNDHEKAYDLTYPKLIAQKLQTFKTREKVIEYVKKDAEAYEADGNKLLKISIAEIGKVEKFDDELISIITMIVENKSPNGLTKGQMPLVSVSNDGGKNWTFIDGLNQEGFNRFFPKASKKIQVPNPKRVD